MDTNVIVKVNGKEVALNNYLAKIFTKINLAIVETLKGIDTENIHEIEVIIENLP